MRADQIRGLKEDKKRLIGELRTMTAVIDKNGGNWTAEEKAEFDRIEEQVTSINSTLDRETSVRSMTGAYNPQDDEHQRNRAPGKGESSYRNYRAAESSSSTHTGEYPELFWKYMTTLDPREVSPDLLVEMRTQSKGVSTAGGYLVPIDVSTDVLSAARAQGPMARLARTYTTSTGDEFRVPIFSPHGTAAWLAESSAYTASDETINLATLNAFKAATLVVATEELVTDSQVDLGNFIANEVGQRIGQLEETSFMVGDGTGKPLGVATSGNGITTTTLGAGGVTTLTYTLMANALATLPLQYRANASLIVSDSVYQALLLMVDGNQRPIFNVDITTTGPDTFLGYPVYVSPDLPARAANSRSMVFGDFRQAYILRRVNGVYVQRLIELYAANGQIGWRAYERVDGRIGLADAARVIAFAAT